MGYTMAQTASEQNARQGEESIEVVEFLLGEKRYVIDVEDINSIEESKSLTRVPRSAETIKGITDIRGDIVVVIEPHFLLDVSVNEEPKSEQRLMLLDSSVNNQKIGLIVDQVSGVEEYSAEEYESASTSDIETKGVEEGVVAGVLYRDDGAKSGLISLLDVDEIISASRIEL